MDILDLTDGVDRYSNRRKITKPRYDRVREELMKFAQARLDGKHDLGIPWFRRHGMPKLNQKLEESGEEKFAYDLSESVMADWLSANHPDLREAFRR